MMDRNSTVNQTTDEEGSITDDHVVSLTAVTVFTLLLGVALNGFVSAVFLMDKKILAKTANIMIFSITVSDFLQSAVASPMLLMATVSGHWVLGIDVCRIYGFLMTFFGLVSITHLSALSVERYLCLKYAMTNGREYRGTSYGKQAVLLMWFYSFFWSVAPLLGWSSYTMEPSGVSCSVRWYSKAVLDLSFNICLIICCFVIPMSVIVMSYSLMTVTIRSISTRAIVSWGRHASHTKCTIKKERGMILLVIAMIIAFLLAWTPYVIACVMSMLGNEDAMSSLATTIASFFAKTSTLYNPALYVFLYRDFKKSLSRQSKSRRDSDFSHSSSKVATSRSRSIKLCLTYNGGVTKST